MRNRLTALAAVAALAATLTACGTSGSVGEPQSGSNKPSASSDASAPAAEDTASDTAKFGKTFTYKDGLSITVSAPKAYKPSEYAAVKGAKAHLMFTITVVNKTKKTFDPSLFYITIQSANEEAEQAFDMEKGLKGSPSTKLLTGREAKFKVGFGVADPKDLVMEVNPGAFDYEPAIFTL